MIRCIRVFCLFVLIFSAGRGLNAQVQTGTPPLGSFGGGPDIINLANLNSHITIPVLHKPGRGGFDFNYNLGYDTSVWYPVGSSGSQSWQPTANWGWTSSTTAVAGQITYGFTFAGICPYVVNQIVLYHGHTYYYTNWIFYDDLGTPHAFVGTTQESYTDGSCTPPPPTSLNVPTTDGSGYYLQATGSSGSVYNSKGTLIGPPINAFAGPGTLIDRNGNVISIDNSGNITDTLGVVALVDAGSGTPSSPITFTYTAPNGQPVAYTIKYTAYTVQTAFGCSGISEYGPTSNNLISEIDLPDGSKYSFAYEHTPGVPANFTGRLASITLPTGGVISYTYSGANNGITCADGSVATLGRSTPDGNWTYAQVKGSGAASTTTVTDPQGNVTTIQFQGIYETQRVSTLLTTNTCYNASASPCTGTAITLPISQRDIYTQPGSSNLESKHTEKYTAYGMTSEIDDSDYGTGAPGALLQTVSINYASLGNINAFQKQVTVKSGATVVSQTNYNYDETGVTTTSGTPQHGSISGSRGNLTSINYPVNGLTAHYTYYDTGNVNTATDVNTAQTTYTYGACGNSLPTAIAEPLGMSRTIAWDANCFGGVQTSVRDENNQTTTTTYNDPYFWRPASVTDPTGAVTSFCYGLLSNGTCSLNTNQAESTLAFNSNNSTRDILTTLDGLGRVHLRQTRRAPVSGTFDTVETDYDALGRASRVTLPYGGPAGQTNSSAPATTMSYDALSRPVQITDAGNGTVSYSYPQNDVLMTIGPAPSGEHTKSRQLQYDALGRLTSVCEITSASGSGACSQSAAQTGFWTTYSHTFDSQAHPLLNVVQNAQASSGTQTRSYTYDAMNRLISENNPESGTTAYATDTDSTCGTSMGDRIKRVDAVGNTTCYSYDLLHRLTSTTYSGPYTANTPNKYLVYDSAAVNNIAMQYVTGRLAEAYTATSQSGTKITDEGFSYTVRGELSDFYESTPHSGGYYHVNQTYWPHGAVSQVSGNIGLPTIQYGGTIGSTVGLDGEGRVTQVTASSGQNPVTGVSFNSASQPTQVIFGSGDTDIFAYDPNTTRMTQYQFKVNSQSNTGTLTWNANSTLQQLAITDAFNNANNQTCSYGYDDLIRLTSANCGAAAAQSFAYDAFGNINKSGSPYTFQPTYSATTNRMTAVGTFVPTYDANGNVTADSLHTYTWDADGNSVTIDGIGLTFDALDRAVEKNNGTYTEIAYSPTGAKLALMSGATLQKAFVALPGRAQAVYTAASGLSYYRHSDWIGSYRLSSTSTATASTPGTGSATVSGSEQSIPGAPATAGTGSVTLSGTLLSKQTQTAAAGTGAVTLNGSLQSKQVQTQGATSGTGSVTITGTERSYVTNTCPPHSCLVTEYDTGSVTITINGTPTTVNYGSGSTPTSIASTLASGINGNTNGSLNSLVSASASNGTVTITARQTGSQTNYSLSASSASTSPHYPGSTSFPVSASGATLTGGSNAVYTTVYDSGTCTITVNSHGDSTSWSGSGTTTSSIASALASSISGDSGASVNASASGATVNLTAKTTGAGTNYSLSSSCSYDSSHFSGPSFTTSNSGSTLTGGQNTIVIYDSGTSTITVNGHADSASWSGSSTTASSIAAALASNINTDSAASVTASASGSIVTLTSKTTGASTNYSLSSSSTYDSTDFSSPSFTTSNSGSTLTGGSAAGATTYDSGNVWVTINGTQYTVSYSQGSTGSSLATTLATAINGSIVTASASGSTITLTAATTGSNTNYSLSSGSSTNQPSTFSNPSFTVSVSGATMTGGTTGGTSMYADTAYAPFGEPYAQAGASDLSYTGQNSDTTSGDYDFLYRKYSNQGRWASPDPAGLSAVNPTNPQSWNRYAYVRNGPLFLKDPLGLYCEGGKQDGSDDGSAQGKIGCSQGGGTWIEDISTQIACPPDTPSGTICSISVGYTNNAYSVDPTYGGANGPGDPLGTPPTGPVAASKSWITASTDAAGIAGLFLKGKVSKLLGRATAGVSIYNDPSMQNIITNLLGVFEGFEGPMAITGAFNDFLDWGANNSTPGPQKVDPYGPQTLQPALPVQDWCAAAGTGPC